MDTVTKYVIGAKVDSFKKSMGFGDEEDEVDKEAEAEVNYDNFIFYTLFELIYLEFFNFTPIYFLFFIFFYFFFV
mgnify:CR=1 FL=1